MSCTGSFFCRSGVCGLFGPFQCQRNNSHVFFPNIANLDFTVMQLENMVPLDNISPGVGRIYPVASKMIEPLCSGTVVAVEYCYKKIHVNASSFYIIFGTNVNGSLRIENYEIYPEVSDCISRCCATTKITGQYNISQESSIGIAYVPGSPPLHILKLPDTRMQIRQYEVPVHNVPKLPRRDLRIEQDQLLLLRIFIGSYS